MDCVSKSKIERRQLCVIKCWWMLLQVLVWSHVSVVPVNNKPLPTGTLKCLVLMWSHVPVVPVNNKPLPTGTLKTQGLIWSQIDVLVDSFSHREMEKFHKKRTELVIKESVKGRSNLMCSAVFLF